PVQTVALVGPGPRGCLLGMLAAARKARVIMVGKSGWRFDHVKKLGFARWLDAVTTDSVVADVRAAAGGRGAEIVIDATGRPEVWGQAVESVGSGGSVVVFGGVGPGTTIRR